jgi:hypothetical protein
MGCVMRENRGSKYSFQVAMGAVNNWVTHLTRLYTLYDSYGDRTVEGGDYVILTQGGTCESLHKHDTTCAIC